jgi:hypothetical protein
LGKEARLSLRPYSKTLKITYIPFDSAEPSVKSMEQMARTISIMARVKRRWDNDSEEALPWDALLMSIWMVKTYGAPGLAKYLMDWTVKLAVRGKAQEMDVEDVPWADWYVSRPMMVVSLTHLAESCATLDELRSTLSSKKPEPSKPKTGVPLHVGKLARLINASEELTPFRGVLFPDLGDAKALKFNARVKIYKRKDGTIRYSVKEEDQSAGSSQSGEAWDERCI